MRKQNRLILFPLLAAVYCTSLPAWADNVPSLHQVYQAAQAGKLSEAQGMMQQVLQAHPNSAKAHYVEAELLAKQGQTGQARDELHKAEQLQPGLPFAKPQAVNELERQLGRGQTSQAAPSAFSPAPGKTGLPWGMIMLGLGLAAVLALVFRAFTARNTPSYYPATPSNTLPPNNPYGGYSSGMPAYTPPPAPSGGGIGSGIMTGLATGAAVGAGMVAGEALAHHFMDGDSTNSAPPAPLAANDYAGSDNMGGADFGISDDSSWDDSGSSGNDDWS